MAEMPRQRRHTRATGIVVLADGTVFHGIGQGATGEAVGELCYNTAMTGYQEVMTDPSYADQIVCFTFPHIGNTGTTAEDMESTAAHALGCIMAEPVTAPSNFRSTRDFNAWLADHGRIAVTGIDTRALTRHVRRFGAPNAVIAHNPQGNFDVEALVARAKAWRGLEGVDLAPTVTTTASTEWTGGTWALGRGHAEISAAPDAPHVVAVDYGIKTAILRQLVAAGARVTLVPAQTSFADIMALKPDGLFLSNGPGDPAATAEYAVPMIRQWLETGKPLFGICLGHQMLAIAIGGKTIKMTQGHHGANHPVKRLDSGRVEITSMNHGFTVDIDSLPANARMTHVSLFDGTLCGLELVDRPAFSVQHHPEASPGPQDSQYLFQRFVEDMQ